MDGYTVTEAATVLGVPTERVWELLARGILVGDPMPQGDMRVYLQPRPAPLAHPDESPRAGNGDPAASAAESSPFRALLTEFRNLTERYGQALLALGEARGEVAGLRQRVELLEARVDVRPPAPMPANPVAWDLGGSTLPRPAATTRAPVEPVPQPDLAAERAVEAERETPVEVAPDEVRGDVGPPQAKGTRRRRRPRSDRSAAIARLAEALARADDPTLAALSAATAASELDGEEEAAESIPPPGPAPTAPSSRHASVQAVERGDDAGPQVEQDVAAEPMPYAEEPQSERRPAPPIDDGWASTASVDEVAPAVPPEPSPAEAIDTSEAWEAQPAASLDEPPPDVAEDAPFDETIAEEYTATVDEPDWLGSDVEIEVTEARSVEPTEPESEPAPPASVELEPTEARPDPWAVERPADIDRAEAGWITPVEAPADTWTAGVQPDEQPPAVDDADGMETAVPGWAAGAAAELDDRDATVEAPVADDIWMEDWSGSPPASPPDAPAATGSDADAPAEEAAPNDLPGGRELDEALAALDALAAQLPPPAAVPDTQPEPAPAGVSDMPSDERGATVEALPEPDTPWPRERRSPAVRAFRRFRRIFPD